MAVADAIEHNAGTQRPRRVVYGMMGVLCVVLTSCNVLVGLTSKGGGSAGGTTEEVTTTVLETPDGTATVTEHPTETVHEDLEDPEPEAEQAEEPEEAEGEPALEPQPAPFVVPEVEEPAPAVEQPVVPAEVQEPDGGGAAFYANCAAARAAGAAPILVGEPGYRSALDRDGDGVACE